MSCSVFKEFAEPNDNHVVVVINKNGNVSVDQSDLHDFLVSDTTKSNTTVSVVRLTSPTSSIEQELNEQEELEREMAKGLHLSDKLEENCETEDIPKIPSVNVVVEKYYDRDEAKQLASEILSAAGITNPLQVVIDLDYQRLAVSNDHCYTPFTSPSQRKNESRRNTPIQITKKPEVVKAKPKQNLSKGSLKKVEASEEEEDVSDEEVDDSESENTYYSPSENENDRDSDLDFNVNDRPSRVRKFNRTKNPRNRKIKGIGKVTRKRSSVGDEDKSDEPSTSFVKRKPVKRRSGSTNKTVRSTTIKGTSSIKVSNKPEIDVEVKKDSVPTSSTSIVAVSGPPIPALAPITNPRSLLAPLKREKKPSPHVDAYISNMSSLFSTPDIIKKVGGGTKSSANITTIPTTTAISTNKVYFMPLTPTSIKHPQQLPSHISVRTHTAVADLEFEQDKQLDLIDSFVQEELKQNTPPHIPNIVNMLENPSVMMSDVTNPIPSTRITAYSNATIIRDTLLDDSDILGLTHAEDCLPDDLLQHVAKLVEDKKIQEVIDKQVLEGKATIATAQTRNLAQSSVLATQTETSIIKSTATINELVAVVKPNKTIDGTKDKALQSKILTATTPTMMTSTASPKEPIKIVRHGRVIILPPVEAPTTRAKRRALTQSFDTVEKTDPATAIPKNKPIIKVLEETKEKKVRRSSISKKAIEQQNVKTGVPPTTVAEQIDDDDYDDEDSDGSYNAEDDPYRLWCICRQPHNNRFMICCDKCEDWFHGKCVNVTKAMGTEMEEQGIEWVCPNCMKKQSGKKLPERKSSLQKSSSQNSSLLSCIVCKNQARPNSVFCSDDCIRKHAKTTAPNVSSSQNDFLGMSERKKLTSSVQPKLNSKAEYTITKNNRVIVFESKSGRVLTGNTAPTPETLKQWLQDNPTFEVVRPGSKQEQFIKEKQEQLNRERLKKPNLQVEKPKVQPSSPSQQQKIQTILKAGPLKTLTVTNPVKKSVQSTPTPPPPPRIVSKVQKVSVQNSPKPSTSVKQNTVTKVVTKPMKAPANRTSHQNKRKSDPKSESKSAESKSDTSSETIRVTVRRLLNEAISQRMSEVTESKHPKLTANEIDNFASDTEREIYHLFSKDIGAKYRAKYRSLVFNIKDRKNDSLFQKICEKTIQPNQFVRMSAEELASQQLARWRENENKHQLEMIKKSELDLLACAKNYVLKTHKGEEVIESKVSDRVTLDPSVSVEDVVSVLNNSTVSSTSENTIHQYSPTKDQRIDTRFDKYLFVDNSGISGMKLASSLSSSTSKKKDVRRSRSRSRDRSQDKHESRKSTLTKHKRKKSRERPSKSRERRSKSRDKRSGEKSDKTVDDRSRDKERDKKKDDKDKRDREKQLKNVDSKEEHKKSSVKLKEPPKPIKKEDNFNLIDKILEAQSTIDRVLRAEDTKKDETKIASTLLQHETLDEQRSKLAPSSECDQEPSSTVTIPTPPEYMFNKQLIDDETILWSGTITMIDIAEFQISIHGISGDCDSIKNELPVELDIVGRIIPDTVWEYIDKIKKNKEILLIRLSAATEDDNEAYYELYKYLYTKKRLGVIKTQSRSLKDFYIYPLAAHKSLPSVLQPIDGQNFESGRPDLLLGIIVKTTLQLPMKRAVPALPPVVVSKVARMSDLSLLKPRTAIISSNTPPTSPNLQKSHATEKGLPTEALEDGDEPYSPGGSDDEIPFPPLKPISSAPIQPSLYAQMEQDEIQRKMEELNRQIEAQKIEIAGMLHSDPVTIDEPYSPTSSMSTSAKPAALPALANISIPSNLQEILNSIKVSSLQQPELSSLKSAGANNDEEYTPALMDREYLSAEYISAKTPVSLTNFQTLSTDAMQSTSKEPSKLAQLSEEELMSLVPDHIELPPVTSFKRQSHETVTARKSYDMYEPPPPGEEEYIP